MVPEPKHPEPLLRQPGIPGFVPGVTKMLPAINLDHQPLPEAGEINDVRTNRDLPTETRSKGSAPKLSPEPTLGVSHVLPQIPGVAGALVVNHGAAEQWQILPKKGTSGLLGLPPS